MEHNMEMAVEDSKAYVLHSAALFSLRSLFQQDTNEFWIALNDNKADQFGDIIIRHSDNMYVIKVKHCSNFDDIISEEEFLSTTSHFSLVNYLYDVSNFNLKPFLDLNKIRCFENLDKPENSNLLFYTNVTLPTCKVLNDVQGSTPSIFGVSAVYKKIKFENVLVDTHIPSVIPKNVYICSNYSTCNDINVEIMNEIRHFVNDTKINLEKASNKFLKFVQLNLMEDGHITKKQITNNVIKILLRQYEVNIEQASLPLCDVQPEKLKIWNKVIKNTTIVIVESDEKVLKFLLTHVLEEIQKFKENENHCKEEFTFFDIYKLLWMNQKLPLLLQINKIVDYANILSILKLSKDPLRIILLNNTLESLPVDHSNLWQSSSSLKNLNEQEREYIFSLPVKLQGRPIILKKVIDNAMFDFLKFCDIIKLLLGNFNIGNEFVYSENLIPRSVSKVLIELRVFDEILDETFLIEDCENRCDEHMFVKYETVSKLEEVKTYNQGVIVINSPFTLEQLKESKLLTKNVHHLKLFNKRHLEWKNSLGSLEKIRKFRVELNDTTQNLTKNFFKPIMIINGAPGMGKSTLLDIIFRKIPTDKWIIKVDLNEHQKYYNSFRTAESDSTETLNYFNNYYLNKQKCNSQLVRRTFQQFLERKDLIVLLDGFDEISVCYKQEVSQIAKSIHLGGFQTWITTRPVMKNYLEDIFNTFSYTLKPFIAEDQKRYLTNYFKTISNDSEILIVEFVKKLLKLSGENINDDFAGTPLYGKLLAGAFREDYRNYISNNSVTMKDNFDLLYLYQSFIDGKINELCGKFNAIQEKDCVAVKQHQALFALKLLFPFDDNVEIENEIEYYRNEPAKIQLVQREGLITVDEELNINFTHRTFAEFLAAQWLSENIHSKTAQSLIKYRFSNNYKFLFDVFDRFLAKDIPLHLAIINNRIDEAGKLINSDKSCVSCRDKAGRTVLHVLALYSIQFPLLFHEYANFYPSSEATHFISAKGFERDALLAIIEQIPDSIMSDINKDILGYNPLDYALANNSLSCAHKIYSKLKPSAINASISLKFKKSYLGYCALLNYKALFNLLLVHFASRDIILKSICGDITVNAYFQGMFSCNTYTKSILNYKIDFGAMTILNLLPSKNDHSGHINGHYCDLHYAVIFNYIDDVMKLLEHSSEINIVDYDGNTLLHYAALHKRPEILILLLSKGVGLNKQNNSGDTALHIALRENQTEIANTLLAKRANGYLANKEGETPLHIAIQRHYDEVSKKILCSGELNDKQNFSGNTPFHLALKTSQLDIAELLFVKGSNGNTSNRMGETPLHLAIQKGYCDLVHGIINKSCGNNVQNLDGNTPVHLALMRGFYDIAELMISSGTYYVDVSNKKGETPLHCASQKGFLNIVLKLVSTCKDINKDTSINLELLETPNNSSKLFVSHNIHAPLECHFINRQTNLGDTALHISSRRNSWDITRLLILKGSDVNIKNNKQETVLHLLIQNNYADLLEILATGNINSEQNEDGNTPLHLALIYNRLDVAKLLISNGASVCVQNNKNENPLHLTIRHGCKENLLSQILMQDVYVNDTDAEGNTALHLALMGNYFNTLNMFLSKGADVNILNNQGDSALSYAVERGYTEPVNQMISKNKIDNKWEKNGYPLLHLALIKGYADIAELLISRGIDIDIANKNYETALHLAIKNKHYALVEKLISKNSVNTRQPKDGNTPLHCALVRNEIDIVKLLLDNGASINTGNKNGKTAIHCAAKNGQIEALKELLSREGANVNKESKTGDTPLHLASSKGHSEIVKLLLSCGADIDLKNKYKTTDTNP